MKFIFALLLMLTSEVAVGQELTKLPQDQDKWYLTVFGTPGEAKYEAVKKWFSQEPLQDVKRQTHYNAFRSDSTMFSERYSSSTKDLPCVRLQNAKGKVIYQASGSNVPGTPEALYDSMAQTLQGTENCPWKKTPPKEPDPEPAVPDDKGGPPDTVNPPEAPKTGVPIWVFIVGGLAAAVAGAYKKIKQTYNPEA